MPTPPTPVSVTSRSRSTSSISAVTSSVRPISSVRTVGRFVGTASTDRNGGNTPSPTWNTCSAAARSRSRCSPRLRSGTPVAGERRGRLRTHHLPAVRDRHQPRRAIHRRAEVVAVRARTPHPCAHRCAPGPSRRPATAPPPAPPASRPPRPAHRRPGRTPTREPVAAVVNDIPVVPLDRRAHQRVVPFQRRPHRIGHRLPQLRRTLDVREQERHGPRRRLRHEPRRYRQLVRPGTLLGWHRARGLATRRPATSTSPIRFSATVRSTCCCSPGGCSRSTASTRSLRWLGSSVGWPRSRA